MLCHTALKNAPCPACGRGILCLGEETHGPRYCICNLCGAHFMAATFVRLDSTTRPYKGSED